MSNSSATSVIGYLALRCSRSRHCSELCPCPTWMLMPKKNRIAIYELLFKEGVMVAKKDVHMPKHPELVDKNVPNLHVMKAMQSLKSRGYVKEQFAWRHFYWYLTNEGIQYLRDYLHLPPETGRPRPKVCYRRERENYCSHGWQNSIARSLGESFSRFWATSYSSQQALYTPLGTESVSMCVYVVGEFCLQILQLC
uniref:Plectin/eS10 N-terminal domain-containing protein n=1 Tax=Apteryx owenii TaxID=8824 RepID=A0A8B9PAT4_APTOW